MAEHSVTSSPPAACNSHYRSLVSQDIPVCIGAGIGPIPIDAASHVETMPIHPGNVLSSRVPTDNRRLTPFGNAWTVRVIESDVENASARITLDRVRNVGWAGSCRPE